MEEHKSIFIQTIPRGKETIIIANNAPDHNNGGLPLPLPLPNKRKRSSLLQLLRAALFMLRFRSSRKSKSRSSLHFLKGLLGYMRPMHLHTLNQSIEAKPEELLKEEDKSLPVGENIDETKLSSSSLSPATDMSTSPVFYRSTYGSMSDLSIYDSPSNVAGGGGIIHRVQSCDVFAQGQEEFWYDYEGGDGMIDAKAEEFIAQFYQQMRLDDQNYISRY